MSNLNLSEIIKSSQVVVHKGRYACLKGKETQLKNHFLVSKDSDEITIVTEEKNVADTNYEKDVKWFKLFEIKVANPFVATGFLAAVTKAIADKGLNLLVVSTFSKDYVLVKEETFETAVEALKEIGFPVEVS